MEEEIIRYIDFIKYLEFSDTKESVDPDKLANRTSIILPKSLKSTFATYKNDLDFKTLIGKKLFDIKSYNTFCLNILNLLLYKSATKICYINEKLFNRTFLSTTIIGHSSIIQDKLITENCAFIFKNNSTNLIFSFGHQSAKTLQNLSNHICAFDNNNYKNIHIVVFKNPGELNEARQLNKASVYKRSFLTSFDKICAKIAEVDKDSYKKIFSTRWNDSINPPDYVNVANLHNIEIINNIPVGTGESKLYKLIFKTGDAIDILPGQFIMIDTLKERQKEISKYYKPKILKSISNVKPDVHNDLKTNRLSYLKRPFGIYRTYYENFSCDYLSNLNLDKEIASILYTIKPNKFEILYKVLDKGVGTNELIKLKKGDNVEILAPLGKIFNFREILEKGIDEIHIVGGGVGIAPLVFLAQMVRCFNIKIKAFIGIEKYSSLTYKDVDPQSFTSTGRNAKIYIDDLKYLGLSETSDIYVSFLSNTDEESTIEIKNLYKGSFVTEPYAEYLKKNNSLKILTFTCGPLPMMQKVDNLTAQYNIKSYVLMEKRMACGIGVCFSCVCKTIENGENHYSRVCIDGPIIESNKINWNEQES